MHNHRSISFLISLSVCLLLVITGHAQTVVESAESQTRPEYKFISTTKTSTFERELNIAAIQGFRLVKLAKSSITFGVAGLVVREPGTNSPGTKYQYKLLSTSKLSTLKKEFEQAINQGFELRGMTALQELNPFGLAQTIAILERPTGEIKRRFEYRFQSSKGEKQTQKELDAITSEGFQPIEMIISQDGNALSFLGVPRTRTTIVFSRNLNDPSARVRSHEYRFLETNRTSTMEMEINKLAGEGFQYSLGSIASTTIMSRPLMTNTRRYEYKLLSTIKTGTMQKELLDTGRQGYSYLPISAGLGGGYAVMERPISIETGKRIYEYKLVSTSQEDTTQRELNEALAAGYLFLDLSTLGEKLIVLGREMGTDAKPAEGQAEK
jgi:predicted secreted protein